jgi:predicted oxidoreductase
VVGDFELRAPVVIVASGGIGGNHDLVRKHWPADYGPPPSRMLSGVPDHVDGLMLGVVEAAGGRYIHTDRMWHYPEGIANPSPIWTGHGIRILSGPSPLWLDARGRRLPPPLFPGWDSLSSLRHITRSGFDHSWFLLNRRILDREFALSGSEQNPDFTGRDLGLTLRQRMGSAPRPVDAFVRHGADAVVAPRLTELVAKMNALTGDTLIDAAELETQVVARDQQVASRLGKDAQLLGIRAARRYLGDRLIRVVAPHEMLDPAAGPLIAVRLSILTRKTLGGLETDLCGRVLRSSGEPLGGVFAAGEVAGFGGGGMHGYRALEGTFLGGCLFSGRVAGRAAAELLA